LIVTLVERGNEKERSIGREERERHKVEWE